MREEIQWQIKIVNILFCVISFIIICFEKAKCEWYLYEITILLESTESIYRFNLNYAS